MISHRERWPKYGEYEFLPEQRWLHGAEHGALVFLYNPCKINQADLCRLRNFIHGVTAYFQAKADQRFFKYGDDDDEKVRFRYVLTPYKDLRKELGIIAFNGAYFSGCWNPPAMLDFIESYYRRAHEDWPPDGPYDYLWVDYHFSGDHLADTGCVVTDEIAAEYYEEWKPQIPTMSPSALAFDITVTSNQPAVESDSNMILGILLVILGFVAGILAVVCGHKCVAKYEPVSTSGDTANAVELTDCGDTANALGDRL